MPASPPPHQSPREPRTAADDAQHGLDDSSTHDSSSGSGTGHVGHDDPTRASAETIAATPPDLEGARIEGYQLLEEIHRGGQGVVYRAIQLGTKRQVALKVLLEGPFASKAMRRRFEREVELAASLHHPNIVTILDSGISQGRYYFAMEYVDGLRLDRYLAKMRPSLKETLRLFVTICNTVNSAHQRGVIHRDLKPPNILVSDDGQPHVLDFGLAKAIHAPGTDQPTLPAVSSVGELLGTVAYMSPEQTLSAADVDVRSDVYSLGVVFYEALLGRLPYSVDGPLGEVLTRIAQADPERPRAARRHSRFGQMVNDELETILLKTLEKSPGRRYQSAGELAADLARLLCGEPIEAKRASGLYVLRKTLARYKLQAGVASAALLSMVLLLVGFAFLWTSEREAKRVADSDRRAAQQHAIEARNARDELARALAQQTIQRGELSQARGDLVAARDFYWDAYERSHSPGATWALRQYYLETGDSGAVALNVGGRGPSALSPDIRLAAVCETASAITIRQTASGRAVGWLHAPGPVGILSIDDQGTVCAAGRGWARLWNAGTLAPAVAVDLPDDFRALAAYAVSGERRLLLVGSQRVVCLEGPAGTESGRTEMLGLPAGDADYSAQLEQLAIPTPAGVQWVTIDTEGRLTSRLIGPPGAQPRGVRFCGAQLLAAAAEAVYAVPVFDPLPSRWSRLAGALAGWDWFDTARDTGALVFGTRDGHVALLHPNRREEMWRITVGDLAGVRLTADGATPVTLDQRGTLTRWTPRSGSGADRPILTRPLTTWAGAEDGSSVLLADDRQRVTAYSPQRSPTTEKFGARGPLSLLPGRGGEELLMAVSSQGRHAVVCTGSTIRLRDAEMGTATVTMWNDAQYSALKHVAITGDGRLVALCGQTTAADRQQVNFRHWPTGPLSEQSADLGEMLRPTGNSHELVGSVIRQVGFQPHSTRLLVARSNGDLLWLVAEPGDPPPSAQPAAASLPWAHLDSPPGTFVFNPAGEKLAVACDDGLVRVLDTQDGSVHHRIRVELPVRSLAFDPQGDVLLIGTNDGAVGLYEFETAERVAQLVAPVAGGSGFGMWVGNAGALLLSSVDGVREQLYRDTNAMIARNRSYARQRAVGRHLASDDVEAAWDAAAELGRLDAELGRSTQETVLATTLRHPGQPLPPAWTEAVLSHAAAATWLHMGHAAYDGERFDVARGWLRRGEEQAGEVDADTALRLAQCDYLAGDVVQSAVELAQWLQRPDLDGAVVPTVQLQQVAALVMGGQRDEARAAAQGIGSVRQEGPRWDPVAAASARDISRYLTESGTESLMGIGEGLVAASTALLRQFSESSLRFHDDAFFFAGELARQRGDRQAAITQYQGCIDVARDVWPSNWARYRLAQLSGGSP